MKKILTILQIMGEDGRANVHLVLLFLWAARVSSLHEISWIYIAIGLLIALNMQLERFFRSKDAVSLHKKQEERLAKLEGEMSTLSGLISMSNQRNMF